MVPKHFNEICSNYWRNKEEVKVVLSSYFSSFVVGKMDGRSIGALINSISRLLHLVSCQTSKTAAINEFKCIVGMLKPLKCIIDEAFGSPFPWDELLVTAIEELDMAVNEARDFLDKGPHRFGKIYSVRAHSLLFLFFFNLFTLTLVILFH